MHIRREMVMNSYVFTVTVIGIGDGMNEAWLSAVASLADDPGNPPFPDDVVEVEGWDEE